MHLLGVHLLLIIHALVLQPLIDGLKLLNLLLVARQLVRELLIGFRVGRFLGLLVSVKACDYLKFDVTMIS